MGLPWWLIGKESTCNAGDTGWIPESRRSPEEGHGNPLQYSCLENPIDRGYSPQDCKESDSTEATEHTQHSLLCTRNIPLIKGFLLF